MTFRLDNIVICDACSGDYTDSDAPGGMICGSWAICPACAPKWADYRPRNQIVRPPSWLPFREFVVSYRGEDAAIEIGAKKAKL